MITPWHYGRSARTAARLFRPSGALCNFITKRTQDYAHLSVIKILNSNAEPKLLLWLVNAGHTLISTQQKRPFCSPKVTWI
jgi:hypothetical protein